MSVTKLKIPFERVKSFRWWEKVGDITSSQKERVCSGRYIQSFQTERTAEARARGVYNNRLERSPVAVLSPGIVRQHQATAAQQISIEGFDNEIILSDGDGFGRTAQNLFSKRLYYYLRDGQVGTLVEAPEEIADNLLEAQERGERSYQILYQASEILHYELFTQGPRKGRLRDLYLLESPRTEGDVIYERVRRYFFRQQISEDGEQLGIRDGYSIQILERKREEEDYDLSLTRPNDTDEREYNVAEESDQIGERIPFVLCGSGPQDSVLHDILDLDIHLLNLHSELRSVNDYQAFRLVFLFNMNEGQEELREVGQHMIHSFASDGRVESLPPSSPDALERQIHTTEQRIKKIAFRQYNQLLNDDTKQVQSAESRAKDLLALEAFYNDLLDLMIRKEEQIYEFHATYEGVNPDNIQVSVGRDFGFGDPEQKLHRTLLAFNSASRFSPGGDEVQRELMASLIEQLDLTVATGESEEEVKNRLKDGIRNSTVTNPLSTNRQARPQGVARQIAERLQIGDTVRNQNSER